MDPKESKRTISTKYETTIFWAEPSSSWPGLTLLPPPPPPPSFCVPFRCDYRLPGLDPPPPPPTPAFPSPLLPPPAITFVFIWKQPDLRQPTSSLLPAPCSPLLHTLLQPADLINPLLAASPHSSSLLLTSYPPCILFFSLLSHYRLSVIRHFSRCFSCSARRRPLWGFSLIFRLQQVLKKMWLTTPKSGPLHTSCNWEDIFIVETNKA